MIRPPVRIFHADHVLPGDAPPIVDGAVVVSADGTGTVLACGKASDVVPKHAGEGATVERVRGVVLPGLVNAHCHLELSAMRGMVPGGRGFVEWVDSLIAQRPEVAPEDDVAAIEAAVCELVRAGTVAVGEVTNSLAAVAALARHGLAGCIFHEVFGHDRASVLRRVDGLRTEREALFPAWPSGDLAYAPAPHTLYTTHADAVRSMLENSMARGRRTSLHLAEHAEERRAIEHGDGPVTAWLASRAKHSPEWARQPLFDFAESVGALSPHVLLVHLVDARREEFERVAAKGSPVVLCPRSNLHIALTLPPLRLMRAAGIEPSLGTDSLASNASLDVLAEAKTLSGNFPDVPPWELVKMATWNGARALGFPLLGRLSAGARPGLLAVEGDARVDDGAAFLLANLNLPRRILVPRLAETS